MKKSLSWTLFVLMMALISACPRPLKTTIKIGMYADLSAGSAQWGNRRA